MKKTICFLAILHVIFLISCAQQYSKTDEKAISPLPRETATQATNTLKEESFLNIDLITEDNISIKGTFYKGSGEMPSIILLHMLDRDRHDWDGFALSLQNIGYNAISIDFRGHGESGLKWRDFSETYFNNLILDVKSAKKFLSDKKIGNDVAIVGASIGANTALNYAVQDGSIKTLILLSPGLNYRGVKIEDSIKEFKNPILMLASQGDAYSAESSNALKSSSKKVALKTYKGSEHGTNLFGSSDADKVIVEWLRENLR